MKTEKYAHISIDDIL